MTKLKMYFKYFATPLVSQCYFMYYIRRTLVQVFHFVLALISKVFMDFMVFVRFHIQYVKRTKEKIIAQ